MANVQFLRGTHANLKTMQAPVIEGAFYLTTDTHRLYTGIKNGSNVELVELNKSIYEVNTEDSLEDAEKVFEEGQFAFVKEGNILAVYIDSQWTQINPDTHLFVNNNTPLFTVSQVNPTVENNKIVKQSSTITGKIRDTFNDETAAHSLQDNVTLSVTGSLTMTVNGKEIILGYTAPESSRVELQGADRTSGGELVGFDIRTLQDNNVTGTAMIEAGDNVTITKASGGQYKINADDMCTTSFTSAPLATNGFKTELVDKNHTQTPLVATIDPIIAVKNINKEATNGTHFNNGTANLDTYSTGAVEALIEEAKSVIDAMTYKGVLSLDSELRDLKNGTTPSSIGDTYKVGVTFESSVETGSLNLHAGDLIICNSSTGEANEQGIIDPEDFVFEVIESGNNYTYEATYGGTGNTRTIDLKEKLYGSSGEGTAKMNIAVTAGNKLSLRNTSNGAFAGAFTLDHDPIVLPAAAQSGYSVPEEDFEGANDQDVLAITSLTIDDYGHVTDFDIKKYKTTDTHTALSNIVNTTTVNNNTVTQKVEVSATIGDPVSQTRTISSNTLTFANVNNNTNTLQVDLQWGSF